MLRERIDLLEDELRAAHERIAELEGELARLQAEQAAENDGERASGPPDSPHGVLANLKALYAAEFPAPPPADPRVLRQHLRTVAQWTHLINREQRQRVEWACRILSREVLDDDPSYIEVESIDLVSGDAVSERFVIEWPRRLGPALARLPDGSPVRLRGLMTPDVRVNESRAQPGIVDIPPLIGPYVEFRYTFQVTAVSSAEIGPAPQPPGPPAPQPKGEPESQEDR